jgi:hypothetical protein
LKTLPPFALKTLEEWGIIPLHLPQFHWVLEKHEHCGNNDNTGNDSHGKGAADDITICDPIIMSSIQSKK